MMREMLIEVINEPFTLTPIHGGDINEAFLVANDDQEFFVKYHFGAYALDMFSKEKKGLELIEAAVPGFTPGVVGIINKEDHSCLVLEYLHSGTSNNQCQSILAHRLTELHQSYADYYGLDHSNFIGKLVQINDNRRSISEFMTYLRYEPQFKLAHDSGYLNRNELPSLNFIERILDGEIPEEKPCLIHGDLWSGNYMCTQSGGVKILDPAVAYVHREMDIAMSRLFGGFSNVFYQAYNDEFPLQRGWEHRLDLFQLYYLLVHLNLFGTSYKASVIRILKKWFS